MYCSDSSSEPRSGGRAYNPRYSVVEWLFCFLAENTTVVHCSPHHIVSAIGGVVVSNVTHFRGSIIVGHRARSSVNAGREGYCLQGQLPYSTALVYSKGQAHSTESTVRRWSRAGDPCTRRGELARTKKALDAACSGGISHDVWLRQDSNQSCCCVLAGAEIRRLWAQSTPVEKRDNGMTWPLSSRPWPILSL